MTRSRFWDRDSAALLGNREMGSMVDMVSQFEVDELYSQINYQDRPVRVSPLRYASLIKWLTNNSEGIPGLYQNRYGDPGHGAGEAGTRG